MNQIQDVLDTATVRAWAKKQRESAEYGKPVPAKGRLSEHVYEDYAADLFGIPVQFYGAALLWQPKPARFSRAYHSLDGLYVSRPDRDGKQGSRDTKLYQVAEGQTLDSALKDILAS